MEKAVTLITGTSRGIGRFLAERYSRSTHHVIGCSRSEASLDVDHYTHYVADVADETAVRELFADVRKKHGRLDNLINNAGIASMNHSLLTPVSTVRQILETNVVGTFLFCREAAKLMRNNRYGRIVNLASVAVPLKLEGEAAYVASKAAVISLTEVLARELSVFGITANIVGPVPIATDLIRSVPKVKIDQLISRQAIRRLGTFEDIANVIDFYLRKESEFVTGQSIFLGGV
jgi:3-oxoacyl-[acyl-carrier protein] reductase